MKTLRVASSTMSIVMRSVGSGRPMAARSGHSTSAAPSFQHVVQVEVGHIGTGIEAVEIGVGYRAEGQTIVLLHEAEGGARYVECRIAGRGADAGPRQARSSPPPDSPASQTMSPAFKASASASPKRFIAGSSIALRTSAEGSLALTRPPPKHLTSNGSPPGQQLRAHRRPFRSNSHRRREGGRRTALLPCRQCPVPPCRDAGPPVSG